MGGCTLGGNPKRDVVYPCDTVYITRHDTVRSRHGPLALRRRLTAARSGISSLPHVLAQDALDLEDRLGMALRGVAGSHDLLRSYAVDVSALVGDDAVV
jgi:hypothetical protein